MAGSFIVGLVLAYFVATASAACTQSQYTCEATSTTGLCVGGVGTCVAPTGCANSGFYTVASSNECVPSCTPFGLYGLTASQTSKSCVTAVNCHNRSPALYGNPVTGTCAAACPSGYYGDSLNGNCYNPPVCPTAQGDDIPYVDSNNICQSAASCTGNNEYVDTYSSTCLTLSACTSTLDSNGLNLTAVTGTSLGNSCECPSVKPYAFVNSTTKVLTCTTPLTCVALSTPATLTYYFADPVTEICSSASCSSVGGQLQWGDVVEGLCVNKTTCTANARFTDTNTGYCVPATLCNNGYGDPTTNDCVPSCSTVVGYPYVNQTSNICSPTAPTISVLYYNVPFTVLTGDTFTQTPNTDRDCLKVDGNATYTPGYTIQSANLGAAICCSEIGVFDSSSNPPCQQSKCGASIPVNGESVGDPSGNIGTYCFGNCYQTSESPDANNQYNLLNDGNNPFYFTSGVIPATFVSDPKSGYAITNRNGLNSGWVVTYGTKRRTPSTVLCLIKGSVSGTTCSYATCAGPNSGTETAAQGYFSYNNAGTEECYLRCYGH